MFAQLERERKKEEEMTKAESASNLATMRKYI